MKILVGADTTAAVQGFNTLETKIGAVKGLFAGFLATATIGGLVSFFASATKAAAEEEDGLKKLERQLERVGVSYASVSQNVISLSKDIQNKTRFADDEAIAALNTLIQKTGDYDFAVGNLALVTDIAAARGESLTTVADKLGLAYNGNTRGLREYGVATKDMANWQAILNDRFGGEAEKDLNSYGGQLRQIQNLWNELKETAGQELLPVIIEVTRAMKEWLQDERNIEAIKTLAGLAGNLASALTSIAKYGPAGGGLGGGWAAGKEAAARLQFDLAAMGGPFGIPNADAMFTPTQRAVGRTNLDKTIDQVKELKFLTSGDLLGNIKQLEGLLSSSKDPVFISQVLQKLVDANAQLRELSTYSNLLADRAGLPDAGDKFGANGLRQGLLRTPILRQEQGPRQELGPSEEELKRQLQAEKNLNRLVFLSRELGLAFESRMASVFGSIRSMADLAAFKIRDVFQALGDAILDILSQIAAKMAAIGLLNLIGGFFGIRGIGGVLGPIIPSGNSIGGGSSFSPATPPVASGFGSNMAPATVYNIFHVQGSVVTERELMDKSRQYNKKMDRYGQA